MNFFQRFVVRLLGHNSDDYVTKHEQNEKLKAITNFRPSEEETRAYAQWRATNPAPPTQADPYPWRRNIKEPPPASSNLRFTDDEKGREAFFRLQCKYGDSDIETNKGIVALVLDAKKELGTPVPVKIEPDGSQVAVLRVTSEDGGFIVCARTPSGDGVPLRAGDFVIWVPMSHSLTTAAQSSDLRFGWIGLIRAKIKTQHPFEIVCRY